MPIMVQYRPVTSKAVGKLVSNVYISEKSVTKVFFYYVSPAYISLREKKKFYGAQ